MRPAPPLRRPHLSCSWCSGSAGCCPWLSGCRLRKLRRPPLRLSALPASAGAAHAPHPLKTPAAAAMLKTTRRRGRQQYRRRMRRRYKKKRQQPSAPLPPLCRITATNQMVGYCASTATMPRLCDSRSPDPDHAAEPAATRADAHDQGGDASRRRGGGRTTDPTKAQPVRGSGGAAGATEPAEAQHSRASESDSSSERACHSDDLEVLSISTSHPV